MTSNTENDTTDPGKGALPSDIVSELNAENVTDPRYGTGASAETWPPPPNAGNPRVARDIHGDSWLLRHIVFGLMQVIMAILAAVLCVVSMTFMICWVIRKGRYRVVPSLLPILAYLFASRQLIRKARPFGYSFGIASILLTAVMTELASWADQWNGDW